MVFSSSSSPAAMSFVFSRRKGTSVRARRGVALSARLRAACRWSPVMPCLSSLGGWNVIGKYEVTVSKRAVRVSSETQEASYSPSSCRAMEKLRRRFRGSRSSSMAPHTPRPSSGPSAATSSCQACRRWCTRSSAALRVSCVCEGGLTSLKSRRARFVTRGSPPSSPPLRPRIRGACWRRSTKRPRSAPSTHCQSPSFEAKKRARVSACLKFSPSLEASLMQSASSWTAQRRTCGASGSLRGFSR
mmetsp:Transcript_125232/g.389852  ORF Transcript_125232/g.389852 Transcript_125232/m.389852 type:complete len:245 (+) Transcript_125232:349-1083(+)